MFVRLQSFPFFIVRNNIESSLNLVELSRRGIW